MDVSRAQFAVAHAQPGLGRQAQHANLALVQISMYVERGLPGIGERVYAGQRGVDPAAGNQPIGLPGLAIVGEM